MSVFGTSAGQSIAGMTNAERIAARDQVRPVDRPRESRRVADRPDAEVDSVELDQAVRSLKGNDQQESQDDRREGEGSMPQPGAKPPRLDLSA